MFIAIEKIIKVGLNYGVAKVEMPYGRTQVAVSPICTNCMSTVLYVILIRSWFTKSFEYMPPWYYRYLMIVPKLCSTKYVPYPIFIIIENIIMVCLNCGIANWERYLTAVPKLWCTIIVMVRFCTDINVLSSSMYPFCIAIDLPLAESISKDSFGVPILPCVYITMSPFCVRPKKVQTPQDKTRRDETRRIKSCTAST